MAHKVCAVDELADGDVRLVTLEGKEIGLFRHGGDYFAYRNICPHQGGPACEGRRLPQVQDLIDAQGLFVGQRFDENDVHIVCPWHGYEFNIRTGRHACDPDVGLQKFEVVVRDGMIHVDV